MISTQLHQHKPVATTNNQDIKKQEYKDQTFNNKEYQDMNNCCFFFFSKSPDDLDLDFEGT